jgi:hypothetical protein
MTEMLIIRLQRCFGMTMAQARLYADLFFGGSRNV